MIDTSIYLAQQARASGLLALEDAHVEDEFFRKALNLVVDGHDPEVVRSILTKDLDLTLKRHREGQSIFKAIGDVAPAMGMIGTLIGLVQRARHHLELLRIHAVPEPTDENVVRQHTVDSDCTRSTSASSCACASSRRRKKRPRARRKSCERPSSRRSTTAAC